MALKIYSNLRVYLESLSIGDADEIAENANDADVARGLGALGFPHPYKRENALAFIEHATKSFLEGTEMHFGIHLQGGSLIGVEGYNFLDFTHKKGEIGYWIGKSYWKQGYGSEAVRLLIGFGFGTLKLHRIQAHTFSFNNASQALLKSLGFSMEGTMREDTREGEGYVDSNIYSLLENEYKDNIKISTEGAVPFFDENGTFKFALS
ncbi:MAG: GNAT family N-acetyltransferase [Candidatus Micrarchaeaceae archaeon]